MCRRCRLSSLTITSEMIDGCWRRRTILRSGSETWVWFKMTKCRIPAEIHVTVLSGWGSEVNWKSIIDRILMGTVKPHRRPSVSRCEQLEGAEGLEHTDWSTANNNTNTHQDSHTPNSSSLSGAVCLENGSGSVTEAWQWRPRCELEELLSVWGLCSAKVRRLF